jgi:hypothetical protein
VNNFCAKIDTIGVTTHIDINVKRERLNYTWKGFAGQGIQA